MTLALAHGQSQPLARVRGAPLHELPADLYIPPEALEVFLETFEGPVDLLLYLIRKADIDVLDIPMASLTAQYLEYVEAMRSRNLELAAEYLLMAAMLMEIKSRMLLPRPRGADDGEADPRAELVRRLLEYERMKLAAQGLDRLPQRGRDFAAVEVWVERSLVERLPSVNAADLEGAWRSLLARARLRQHHKVAREELSVREHMTLILRKLAGGTFHEFGELFEPWRGVAALVVSFLALLELAREGLIEVTQAEPYAPIYARLAEGGQG
jgi:segregation and condensation protein A